MSEPFLRADEVTVQFGGLRAVDAVSLTAGEGEIVGVIGPNGAGKTTLFGAITGLVPLIAGRVHLAGHDVTAWPAERRGRAGLARTFQRLEVFGSMTVRENLLFATEAARLGERPWRLLANRRYQRPTVVDEVIDLLGLRRVADAPLGPLPLGTARLVEFGRALCAEPRLLLLDEPSSGLDASETFAFTQYIRAAVAERGVGVLVIEHDMALVTGICERCYVVEFGKLIASGPTAEITNSAVVQAAYLGTGHGA